MSEHDYYLVKTVKGREANVLRDIEARMTDSSSLHHIKPEIIGWYHQDHMIGYIIIKATNEEFVNILLGHQPTNGSTPIQDARKVLGLLTEDEAQEYLKERNPTDNMEIGDWVEVISGTFQGEVGILRRIKDSEVDLDLDSLPMSLNLSSKRIRKR